MMSWLWRLWEHTSGQGDRGRQIVSFGLPDNKTRQRLLRSALSAAKGYPRSAERSRQPSPGRVAAVIPDRF